MKQIYRLNQGGLGHFVWIKQQSGLLCPAKVMGFGAFSVQQIKSCVKKNVNIGNLGHKAPSCRRWRWLYR